MKMDYKNYDKSGTLPDYFTINGEIKKGEFEKTLNYDNVYDEEEPTYQFVFNYSFDFTFRNKIIGTTFVYRGGFNIEFTRPSGIVYKSPHCNHFSMPMCQHFTSDGRFTQFFIDNISKVLEREYEMLTEDEIGAMTRYLNRKKGS